MNAQARLSDESGFTLVEMLVVLATLGIVLAALTGLFLSATRTAADQNVRFQAQQQARLALDKLRREIHCASGATKGTDGTALAAATAYSSVSFTLGSYCPTNPTASGPTPATAYATWCTAPVSGATNRYQLWRYVTTNPATFVPACSANVTGATKVQWADYLSQALVFPSYVAPQGGSAWNPSTPYTVGQLVRPTNTGTYPYLFSVTGAGTTDSSEPAWPPTLNATVADGPTFKNIGALTFGRGRLSIDLPVDLTPVDAQERYELRDDIVLRNTAR